METLTSLTKENRQSTQRGVHSTVVEQRMTVELLRCGGGRGGVSHPLQLTTGLVINSFIITNSHLGR